MTTTYLVDTQNPTGYAQVVDELQNGAVVRSYSYGLERISETQPINSTLTTSFYGYDGHGSVRFLTNSAGAVTDTYDYDAFGNLINSTGTTPNNYLFAGEQYDPNLGVYYNRARYLNSSTGRFLTMDTFEGKTHDPVSLHKYAYEEDNPVTNTDRTGHEIDLVDAAAAQSIATSLANAQANFGFATVQQILTGGDSGLRSQVSQGAISVSEAFGTLTFLATFSSVVVGDFIVSHWSTSNGKVYRGLAPGEDPKNGLTARNPSANNSPTSHVAGKRDTQWISTTKDPDVAFNKYGEYGVVEIDLSKVNRQVVDLSSGLPDVPSGSMLNNFVRADREVLIQGEIPAEAIKIIESIE